MKSALSITAMIGVLAVAPLTSCARPEQANADGVPGGGHCQAAPSAYSLRHDTTIWSCDDGSVTVSTLGGEARAKIDGAFMLDQYWVEDTPSSFRILRYYPTSEGGEIRIIDASTSRRLERRLSVGGGDTVYGVDVNAPAKCISIATPASTSTRRLRVYAYAPGDDPFDLPARSDIDVVLPDHRTHEIGHAQLSAQRCGRDATGALVLYSSELAQQQVGAQPATFRLVRYGRGGPRVLAEGEIDFRFPPSRAAREVVAIEAGGGGMLRLRGDQVIESSKGVRWLDFDPSTNKGVATFPAANLGDLKMALVCDAAISESSCDGRASRLVYANSARASGAGGAGAGHLVVGEFVVNRDTATADHVASRQDYYWFK